ncbi:MAG TPA: protein kinase [Gemmataceae bacterium]|nr:protein kinase [Gemmataceae bacterium]
MTDPQQRSDVIAGLMESFVAQYRRGEHPSVSEYVRKYPELADQIEELFPALAAMEEFGSAGGTTLNLPPGPGDAAVPEKLGEYCILREVGRGGMGVVYEAVQETLGRHVALKVLPARKASDAMQLERFRREAQAAAKLHHTNIVPVFGVGEHAGVHYYAMQFIPGQSLDAVLDELRRMHDGGSVSTAAPTTASPRNGSVAGVARSLWTGRFAARAPEAAERHVAREAVPSAVTEADGPPASPSELGQQSMSQYVRTATGLALQVADALGYAHKQGVIHRDIKPSNLLLDARGAVWITDFGLAKSEGMDDLTVSGDVVGTLRYMAPERFDGRLDPRSDIYSLGVTLYELLTLRAAYDDVQRPRLIDRIRSAGPPPPRRLNSAIPSDLQTIVLKAAAKEPSDRYATAEALAEDLRRFLADRPIRARRTSLAGRAWRWCRRNPAVGTLIVSVAALLVVIAVGSLLASVELSARHARAAAEARRAGRAEVEVFERLWHAHLNQARANRRTGYGGRRFDSLAAIREAAAIRPGLELRNEAIACLALADLGIVKRCSGPVALESDIEFDADLGHYARSEKDGTISVWRLADDSVISRLPAVGGIPGPLHFSPDGRYLAARHRRREGFEWQVWDLTAGTTAFRCPAPDYLPGKDFSPDGRTVALCQPNGSVRIFDLVSKHEQTLLLPDAELGVLRFHPDGRQLAVASRFARTVRVVDLETGQVTRQFEHPNEVFGLAWSPDGQFLAAGVGWTIRVVHVGSGLLHGVWEGHQNAVMDLAFHPNGSLVASQSWDGTTRLWSFPDGRPLVRADGMFVRMTRDGRRLAFRHGVTAGVWELAEGRECRRLYGHERHAAQVYGATAVSPDGRLLASAGDDGVRLWDLADGREIVHLPIGLTQAVVFHPTDGSLITPVLGKALYRWPVRSDRLTRPGHIAVGPPRRLEMPSGLTPRSVAVDATGTTLAVDVTNRNYAVIFGPDEEARPIVVTAPQLAGVTVSRDGRWVATSNWHGSGVRVWEARTGKRETVLPADHGALIAFSPDNDSLVIFSGDACRFWEVGSWREIQRDGAWGGRGPIAFSADGRVAAIAQSRSRVRLVDTATGRELASLEATPSPAIIDGLCFTRAGDRLIATQAAQGIHVWDLRLIRQRLDEIRLDWDAPAYPPTTPASDVPPVDGSVDFGDLDFAHNRSAWIRVAGPADLRDPAKALAPALQATELQPEDANYQNTLGTVYYRLARYEDAVATFEANLKRKDGDTAADLFVLAMSYQQLGQSDKAHDAYGRAHRWWQANATRLSPKHATELAAFRAEADALLWKK